MLWREGELLALGFSPYIADGGDEGGIRAIYPSFFFFSFLSLFFRSEEGLGDVVGAGSRARRVLHVCAYYNNTFRISKDHDPLGSFRENRCQSGFPTIMSLNLWQGVWQ